MWWWDPWSLSPCIPARIVRHKTAFLLTHRSGPQSLYLPLPEPCLDLPPTVSQDLHGASTLKPVSESLAKVSTFIYKSRGGKGHCSEFMKWTMCWTRRIQCFPNRETQCLAWITKSTTSNIVDSCMCITLVCLFRGDS